MVGSPVVKAKEGKEGCEGTAGIKTKGFLKENIHILTILTVPIMNLIFQIRLKAQKTRDKQHYLKLKILCTAKKINIVKKKHNLYTIMGNRV